MAGPASVEDYLAALPEDQRAALEKLRKTIRAAAPEAIETISYQMPTFKDRVLVYYAAFKDHCSLFPASEAVMEALGEELNPYFSGKGTLRFTPDKPIPAALVKKIVKARIEENEARRRR
ncbi:MAG: iron chaperone [Actinomycetota bacterium]